MDAHGHYARVQPAKPRRTTSSAKQAPKPVKMHGAQSMLMALYASKT
jgi:hypothetical protein